MKGLCWLAVVAASLHAAIPLLAQDNHVAWSKIETGPWMMHPVYSLDANGQASVDNFLALAKPGTASGDNIVAVWYQREATGWQTKSWETTDPWDAVKFVKQELGISDDEDERWELEASINPNTTGQPAQAYSAGLLAEDPLAPLIENAPDQQSLVEFLVSVGYKAASVPIEQQEGCTTSAKLDGMAEEAVTLIASGDETILHVGTSLTLCEAFGGLYPKAPKWGPPNVVKPPKPATAPGWTPAPVMPTAPTWTPNTWSPWVCTATPATGGGTHCVCRRSRRWGAWETRTCGIWPFRGPCIRWHEITERQHCDDTGDGIACPPAGPPAPSLDCPSIFS